MHHISGRQIETLTAELFVSDLGPLEVEIAIAKLKNKSPGSDQFLQN
jgi:hypothetical protein